MLPKETMNGMFACPIPSKRNLYSEFAERDLPMLKKYFLVSRRKIQIGWKNYDLSCSTWKCNRKITRRKQALPAHSISVIRYFGVTLGDISKISRNKIQNFA